MEFGNGYRFKNSSGVFSLVLCDPLMILSAPHIHVGTAETRRTFQSGDEGGGVSATVLIKPLRGRPITTHTHQHKDSEGEVIFGAVVLWMLLRVFLLRERGSIMVFCSEPVSDQVR